MASPSFSAPTTTRPLPGTSISRAGAEYTSLPSRRTRTRVARSTSGPFLRPFSTAQRNSPAPPRHRRVLCLAGAHNAPPRAQIHIRPFLAAVLDRAKNLDRAPALDLPQRRHDAWQVGFVRRWFGIQQDDAGQRESPLLQIRNLEELRGRPDLGRRLV